MTKQGNPFLIDEETLEQDDEIYELAEAGGEGGYEDINETPSIAWTPSDEDEVIVDKLLRETRYYREEIAKLEMLAKAEIDRVKADLARHTSRFRFSLKRRERSLEAFSEATGGARRVSACGVLKWQRGSESVRFLTEDGEIVDNEERFIEAFNDSPFTKIKISVRKTEVKDALKAGDERVAQFAVMDRAPSTFKIEVPK